MEDKYSKKEVALVLSGGGARGCAHVGVIKVLERSGFRITSVAGTSMGALVGGIYATGQIAQFEEWITSLDLMEVLRLTDFSISKKGFVKGKKVIDALKTMIPGRNIEELQIPYAAVATDILNGTETVFTKGSLYEAIRASISIPTVFQPHQINDSFLVDGVLLNPVPVNRVKRSGNDILVVVDVSASIPHEKLNEESTVHSGEEMTEKVKKIQDKLDNVIPVRKKDTLGIFNLTNRSISTMVARISELTLEIYKPDLLIRISRESFSAFDFYKAKEIIKEGEMAAIKALQ